MLDDRFGLPLSTSTAAARDAYVAGADSVLSGVAGYRGSLTDWWFETVYSFAACETGRLDLAWTLVERSLAKNPRHAHAAHFRTHVLYERGEIAEALDYLEGWMPGLDKRSLVHCHLSWHVALAALASALIERRAHMPKLLDIPAGYECPA